MHGEAANTVARREQLNKDYGTRILVSETTRRLGVEARLRPMGEIAIRGRMAKLAVLRRGLRAHRVDGYRCGHLRAA